MNKVYKPIIICIIVFVCSLILCATFIIIGAEAEEEELTLPFIIIGVIFYVAAMVSGLISLRFAPRIRKYKEQMELENQTNRYQKYIVKMNEWEKQLDENLKKYNLTFKEFYENADNYRHQRIVSSIVGNSDRTSLIIIRNGNVILFTTIPIDRVYEFKYTHFKEYKELILEGKIEAKMILEGLTLNQIKESERLMKELNEINLEKEREIFIYDTKYFSLRIGIVESNEYLTSKPTSGMELAIKSELFGVGYTVLSELDKMDRLQRIRYDIGVEHFAKTYHFYLFHKEWFEHIFPEFFR